MLRLDTPKARVAAVGGHVGGLLVLVGLEQKGLVGAAVQVLLVEVEKSALPRAKDDALPVRPPQRHRAVRFPRCQALGDPPLHVEDEDIEAARLRVLGGQRRAPAVGGKSELVIGTRLADRPVSRPLRSNHRSAMTGLPDPRS